MATFWKRGRGKLGPLAPLLGDWHAEATSPQGPVRCTRHFARTLADSYIHLHAIWQVGTRTYEDVTLFGCDRTGTLRFWSFTSDGKQSSGALTDVSDLHLQAIGFEAEMAAGVARQAFWPAEDHGFYWVVEARTKQGWRRMVEHHYVPYTPAGTSDP